MKTYDVTVVVTLDITRIIQVQAEDEKEAKRLAEAEADDTLFNSSHGDVSIHTKQIEYISDNHNDEKEWYDDDCVQRARNARS